MTYDYLKDYEHLSVPFLMRKLKISFDHAEMLYDKYATDEMKHDNLEMQITSRKRNKRVVN
jgi:hypothetical protein